MTALVMAVLLAVSPADKAECERQRIACDANCALQFDQPVETCQQRCEEEFEQCVSPPQN